jgi:CRP/FNR family cyclic AMP-dependent transcriptional regulator
MARLEAGMEMNERPWFIRDTAFSTRISEEDKAAFMQICPVKQYQEGDAVFSSGDPATDLHVIAAGQIKLVVPSDSGQERILAVCGKDDFIGEAFLSTIEHYRVDAIALTEAMTCPISRTQFLQLSLNAPHFVLSFVEILASRLANCRQ